MPWFEAFWVTCLMNCEWDCWIGCLFWIEALRSSKRDMAVATRGMCMLYSVECILWGWKVHSFCDIVTNKESLIRILTLCCLLLQYLGFDLIICICDFNHLSLQALNVRFHLFNWRYVLPFLEPFLIDYILRSFFNCSDCLRISGKEIGGRDQENS